MKCVLLWRSLDHTGEGVGLHPGVPWGGVGGYHDMVYTSVVREGHNEARGQLGQRGHAVSVAIALLATTTGVAAKLLLLSSPSSARSGGRRSGRR